MREVDPAKVARALDLRTRAGAALIDAALNEPGATSPALRAGIVRGEADDPVLEAFVSDVRDRSWRISPERIAELRTAGWSEDSIFEAVVVAAVGAAARGLDAARRALAGE
jgi:hypothetical protein